MKKAIPFDIDLAKQGAKVTTNCGHDVTILTYEGRDPSRPIIGTYMYAVDYEEPEEILDRWPLNGRSIHPGGLDLMVEVEEDFEAYTPLDEVIDLKAKNKEQGVIIRELEARNRELEVINDRLRLEREKSLADIKALERRAEAHEIAVKARKKYYNELEEELAIYREGSFTAAKIGELNKKIKELGTENAKLRDEREVFYERLKKADQWKAEASAQLSRWNTVTEYLQEFVTGPELGKPEQKVVLDRLKLLYDIQTFMRVNGTK